MINLKDFELYLEERVDAFECSKELKESIRYSLISDGKYIRPSLFLSYLKDKNINYKEYFNVAMAIEMVHTYSLIHDDMPCIDNDDYRRGKLSNHKKFGEDIALLTGDALITNAFSILLSNNLISDSLKVDLVMKFSTYAGLEGMIDGQVKDIINNVLDIEDVRSIHIKKTSLLLSLCLEFASLIAKDKKEEEVFELGTKLGLFYQVQDDFLDEYGDEKIGKTIGKDLKQGKRTYAYFLDKEELEKLLEELKMSILESAKNLGLETQDVILKIMKRKK